MSSSDYYKYLYEGTPLVYNLNALFDTYSQTDSSKFEQQLDVASYLSTVQSVSNITHYNRFPVASSTLTFSVNPLSNYNNELMDYSLSLTLAPQDLNVIEFNKLLGFMSPVMNSQKIIASNTDLESKEMSELIPLFEKYMTLFHTTLAKYYFNQVLDVYRDRTNTSLRAGNRNDPVAYRRLQIEDQAPQFIAYEPDKMFEAISNASKSAILEIAKIFNASGRMGELISAFRDRAKMSETNVTIKNGQTGPEPNTKQKWYMLMSGTMFKYLTIDKNLMSSDPLVAYRTKQVLIDVYLKACYPMVHYDALTVMTEYYSQAGDLINARFGLVSKAVFSFQVVKRLNDKASTLRASIPSSLSTDFTNRIQSYVGLISRPKRMQGRVNSEEIFKDVVIEMRNLSNDVVRTSEAIESLKANIGKNQLVLRTLSLANSNNNNAIYWKNVEMICLLVLLILVLVSVSILYLLDKAFMGLMTTCVVLTIVLMYLLILYIIQSLKTSTR